MRNRILLCGVLLLGFVASLFANEVTIYSYRQPFLLKPLLTAFENHSGIKTRVLFLRTGLQERLESEGKFSPADIVLTVDIQRLNQLAQKKLLQPVSSKILEGFLARELRHPKNLWFALSLRARVIYVSKKNIAKNTIQNYQDLADPRWKGKVCTRSGKHSYSLGLIASLIAENGTRETKNWLLAVKQNLARKPQGNDRAQIKAIFSGECDISLGNSYYLGVMAADTKNKTQQKWADAVYVVTPNQKKEGTSINISGIALTKYAPNKKNAIALIEFLVSNEAQKIYATINHEFSVREDIELSEFSQKHFGRFKKNLSGIAQIPTYYQQASDLVNQVKFDF